MLFRRGTCPKTNGVQIADALQAGTSLRQIAASTPLRDAIQKLLKDQWSPRQISHQLRIDFPDRPTDRPAGRARRTPRRAG